MTTQEKRGILRSISRLVCVLRHDLLLRQDRLLRHPDSVAQGRLSLHRGPVAEAAQL